jgi:hypothetical protein
VVTHLRYAFFSFAGEIKERQSKTLQKHADDGQSFHHLIETSWDHAGPRASPHVEAW